MKTVYADNAGTTAMSQAAINAMIPYFRENFGNPSSVYSVGRSAKKALDAARADIAACINCRPSEIYFTSGGSEADNLALKGIAESLSAKGRHIITTPVEHHAVLHALSWLESHGFEITYLPVDKYGMASLEELENAIRSDTILITVMAANNEVGTIMPIKEIGEIAHRHGVLFHTDAVQAVGHIPIDVSSMNVDLLSMSAHKFRGPKGTGALYVKKGTNFTPLIHGGGQERNKRSGTENVAGICGMAAALNESVAHMEENIANVSAMRDRLIKEILKIPKTTLTGHPENRLPGTASFVFECVEGESLLFSLDMEGICASSGSACSSVSLNPSHVLTAMGFPPSLTRGALRLTINECTTDDDINYILEKLPPIVDRLRVASPIWEELNNGNS